MTLWSGLRNMFSAFATAPVAESATERAWRMYDEHPPPKAPEVSYGIYGRPQYPHGIDYLQVMYDDVFEPKKVVAVARLIDGFIFRGVIEQPVMGDRYVAQFAIIFSIPDRDWEAVILFGRKENGRSTRHCAVYLREAGLVGSPHRLEQLVHNLAEALED